MNQCILTGNLGQDPDIRYSQNGDPIASFNLAFRLSKDKTGWIKVVCFNKTAEVAEIYLHKGAKVLLSATLAYRGFCGVGKHNHKMAINPATCIRWSNLSCAYA